MVDKKPTYAELARRVKELEQEKLESIVVKESTILTGESSKHKSKPELTSGTENSEIDLGSIINASEIQAIMDDLYRMTNMLTAVLDLKGKVLVAAGWRDICVNFHRVNPDTASNCTESDLFLASNLKPGEFVGYKCKNGLWDVVTPLYVGNRHMGNVYTGQFFYDDEHIDEELFVKQAERYGFDKDSYLAALRKVPQYSREAIDQLMSYLIKFTTYISKIGFVNLQLEEEIRERKQVEIALKDSETQLRTLLRAIPDLVWLKNADGVYLSCNSRFESLFGAKEKDIIGKTDYDFVDSELADYFRKNDRIAMVKGKAIKYEEQVTFADDGHSEILETIKTPLFGSDGELAGILGIGHDITNRIRMEKEHRESESFIRAVIDNLPIGIAVNSVNPDVKFEYMNDNFIRLYRTSREAITNPDTFWNSVYEDPDFREEMRERILDDCASGDPKRMYWEEVPITRKGEKTTYITARNIPIPEKQLMISTVWDVTNFKEIEAVLKDNERLLNEVGSIANIGGWEMDILSGTAKWTKGTYDIVEIEYDRQPPGPDEHVGYYLPEYRSLVSDSMTALIEDDRPLNFDAQLRTAKGNIKWCRAMGRAVKKEGRCIKVYGTFQDITNLKKAEEEIQELNRNLELRVHQRTLQLAEANKELEDFVYSVSHDLRAPLRSISGFAEIINRRHKAALNEESQHYFDNIVKASKQMGILIDDLLRFSRLGRGALILGPVPLDDVFKAALETLSDPIEATNARISIPEHMPVIHGDLTLATHVFINLLENAIKYRKPNVVPYINVEIEDRESYCIVSLSDNGIGIEPEYHEKIFNIFQRLHGHAEYPGTGIGLAAVKKAIQIMEGEVWVESEPGKGSVFKIKVVKDNERKG